MFSWSLTILMISQMFIFSKMSQMSRKIASSTIPFKRIRKINQFAMKRRLKRHGHLGQLLFVRCLQDVVNTSSGQNLKLSQKNEMDVFVKIVYSIAVNYFLQENTIWLTKNWMSATIAVNKMHSVSEIILEKISKN